MQQIWHVWQRFHKNLLFTPARYSCNRLPVDAMLNFVLAGANNTSPTLIFSIEKGVVLIVPVPSVTKNNDGPAIAGNLVEVPSGRSQ